MGSSKQSTSSQTQPWTPAIPLLNQELGSISGMYNNYMPSQYENAAYGRLKNQAGNIPNLGPQAAGVAQGFLSGDPSGLLGPALSNYQGNVNPIAGASLDPMQTPGIQNALGTVRNDVTNSVNGMFAGAGRDLSGANQQNLARGISQGESNLLLNQYNQNVQNAMNANNGLLGAAGATSGAMSQNQGLGLAAGSALPGMYMQGPLAQIAAGNMQRTAPMQGLAQLLGLTLPIAGLGQEGESTTTSTPSFMQQMGMMNNVLGGSQNGGLFGNLGSMFGLFGAL